jgi:pterin-4a-carbinolamine dehydratase
MAFLFLNTCARLTDDFASHPAIGMHYMHCSVDENE